MLEVEMQEFMKDVRYNTEALEEIVERLSINDTERDEIDINIKNLDNRIRGCYTRLNEVRSQVGMSHIGSTDSSGQTKPKSFIGKPTYKQVQ